MEFNPDFSITNQVSKSNVKPIKTSKRARQSPYPMISVFEALKRVLKESNTLQTTVKSFSECFSFVTADAIFADEAYPQFPASIKDGYAVLADDLSEIRKVIGVVTPGCKLDFDLTNGTCVRVSTGSAIPEKADAVVQVEDTSVVEEDEYGNEVTIRFSKMAVKGQDIRLVGSDVANGQVLVPANKRLSAAEIGVMATCGIKKVLVYEKPRVALLSTGDEIVEPGSELKPGCIRDSNKSSLFYSLVENRIPVIDVGIAKDTADDVKSKLTAAFESADIIITTGGVSMGEKDMLKLVLEVDFNATIHFGRVQMKPGKPCTFSTVVFNTKKKLIFSLPGNPVSTYVCFYLFVIPSIKSLMGYTKTLHTPIRVKLACDLKLDERPEFYRVSLKSNEEGIYEALGTGAQQSSRLLSMQGADALLMLPPASSEQSTVKAGSTVDAILLKTI
ncbi:hypothetical protein JTE90_025621 [Oedothorax gibbosus]|uniref:molybdopterin adenylyltransferase n=1 Tax=Oedothorax gibbosus TaxID=931172 RepID=A0AAV6V8H0_9ARAC|nr:hypothetical protein JTE90_025621 [Oedothorax gibbosus]